MKNVCRFLKKRIFPPKIHLFTIRVRHTKTEIFNVNLFSFGKYVCIFSFATFAARYKLLYVAGVKTQIMCVKEATKNKKKYILL